jgi:hypothetical protein
LRVLPERPDAELVDDQPCLPRVVPMVRRLLDYLKVLEAVVVLDAVAMVYVIAGGDDPASLIRREAMLEHVTVASGERMTRPENADVPAGMPARRLMTSAVANSTAVNL